jgi:hypothetical protein
MMRTNSPVVAPMAYGLKQHIARHVERLWKGPNLAQVLHAPIYLFPDEPAFNSDTAERLACSLYSRSMRLPHDAVMFEVAAEVDTRVRVVLFATQTPEHVDAWLFQYHPKLQVWTDVLARVRVHNYGDDLPADREADFLANPRIPTFEDAYAYGQVLIGMLWRSLGLLSVGAPLQAKALSTLHRKAPAKVGVRGWTYHVVNITPERIAAAIGSLGGSHASPRWHIRRGHWRMLQSGRCVFVRECQVGDQARGAVLKDYRIDLGSAA